MITIEQCRAARGLLSWTQQDLAEACGLSKTAINNFEKGHSDIKAESLNAIRIAFESADIEFLDHNGLKKRKDHVEFLKGQFIFNDVLDDIYDTLKDTGGEILILNPKQDIERHAKPASLNHGMERLNSEQITKRVIHDPKETPLWIKTRFCEYRSQDNLSATTSCFIYGSKVAVFLWDNDVVLLTHSQHASNSERRRFETIWNKSTKAPGTQNGSGNKKNFA